MKKTITALVGILMLVFVGLVLGRNLVAKVVVERGVKLVSGLPLEVQSIDVGLPKTCVAINGLKILNPQGYSEKVMADISQFYADCDVPTFLKKKIHLRDVRIHLEKFVVVRDADRRLNIDALKALQARQKQVAPFPMQIDSLELKIRKVVYTDYALGDKPVTQEFNVDLNETFRDITDPDALVNLIVLKALMSTTIASLANIDLDNMKGMASKGFSTTKGLTVNAFNKTKGVIVDTAPEVMGKTANVVKGTTGTVAEGVKNLFSMPFGKKEEEAAK